MKKTLAFLLCFVMIMGLVACGNNTQNNGGTNNNGTSDNGTGNNGGGATSGEEGSTPGVKKDLIIGIASDINQLNVQMQNDQINNNCISLSHQRLVRLDNETNEKLPSLATSWEWTDDNHLVFYLVENATFSTGEPLTADDVVFTYERAMNPDPTISAISGTLSLVESVQALDTYTVEFTTTSYSNELIDTLMGVPCSILSKAAYEDPNNEEPWLVGSGQYIFDEWVQNQYVRYVRNENYWGDDPGMADEIIFRPLLEASQRVIALQNGEIDVCIDPPTTELQFLEEDENITVHTQAGTRLFYLGFNCEKEPFNNETLRQAVSCAIDKDMIVDVVLGGRGKIQYSVLNRGVWSFLDNDEIEAFTYDLDRAKELMGEAGYPDGGLTVDLYSANSAPYSTIAPIIQANLQAIGITVNIVTLDEATLKTECQAGNQQMFLWRWNVITRLDETYRELFYTDYGTNYHQLSDPYVDEMTDKILTEKDEDARLQESHDLQQYMAEIVPQVPLYVPDLVIAYNKNLKGTYLFGGGNHIWTWAYVSLEG